ncbi:uncharacterized protein si:dkeyp-97a10.3 [Scomber scombrus]|uniref:Uncharacterized protein si:dkeyp-97a10.3 n=1 Tax=Scomber scombrus TaxID=13677 RepID=A0AAV1P1Q0_SCOSC
MRQPLLLISLSLAVLSANVLAQDPVQIQFQTDPLLIQTGTDAAFTVLTVPNVLSMTWQYQGGVTLGLWAGGNAVVNPVAQFQGRVTITATQLRIGSTQLRDAGNYTVEVTPSATTGLATNSRSVQLRVFDAVAGVSLVVPSVAVEGNNVTLSCTWTSGTEITVQWGKGGATITADSRITISDGPDTPVLTKETPKDCVGGGDVLVGNTVRLTCLSDSLPPALFSWQRDGQPVASGQPDSGVLSLPTVSTTESGRYVCMARNGITGGTSEQGTDLAIVDTCINGGEVAGIVIGCLLLIIIIVLLILFLVRRRRDQQRQSDTVVVLKSDANPRPIPSDPQPNGARDLGQGPHPPLYHHNTHTHHPDHLYTGARESPGNPPILLMNGMHNSDTHQHNGRTHTNRLLHNAIQNTNSYPHNGIDNLAFTHTDAQNANTLPNTQQQNPNILIQAGGAQGGAQPPAVHVSLNTLPQTAQQNKNAQMPIIHVNLNSYPTNGQQAHQDSSFPSTNAANNNASQTQIQTGQSNPRMQSGQSYPSDTRQNEHTGTSHQAQSEPIPTGYTHYNGNNTAQRNANTQTYQQNPEPHNRPDRNSAASSSRSQVPWDRLRGTPAYPNETLQRGQTSPEFTSSTTDYTYSPAVHQTRTPNRSQPQPQSQTTSRSRPPARQDAPSVDRHTRSRSADVQSPHTLRVPQLEPDNHTHRSPRTQRERAQQDIRGLPGSQTAHGHEATHSSSPQALPLMNGQASVGRSAVSQGPTTQQGLTSPQGADTRALADPNHLPQAHMSQQNRAAPIQKTPQGLGTQTQPIIHGANQPRQGGTAPVPHPSAQPNPSNLTQAALKAHTERAQTFPNRKQQTQAALLHPGHQAQAPAAGAEHPPAPPPVIPLSQFRTLPKEQTKHKSPNRGPQPPRPPVNIPVAQRHLQVKQRPNTQRHPATTPANHHHHPGNDHMHATAQWQTHGRGHGNPGHFSHQAHRGRPR